MDNTIIIIITVEIILLVFLLPKFIFFTIYHSLTCGAATYTVERRDAAISFLNFFLSTWILLQESLKDDLLPTISCELYFIHSHFLY